MTNLQILADEQSELLVGGFFNFASITTKIKTDVKTFTATANVYTSQSNFATSNGFGRGLVSVGAASSEQANLSAVDIAQAVG
jgi:hypothetical protein